jgi:hypothetical protein
LQNRAIHIRTILHIRAIGVGPPGALYNQYELHSMGQVLLDINCN